MSSIFSKIIKGEIPCYKVAENDNYMAFLDVNPLVEGHTLVIPKQEIDYIFEMSGELFQGLWEFARRVAKPLKQAIPCKKVGVAVIGLEVPHAHIHLIPMNQVSDMNFALPKQKFTAEQFEATLEKIKLAFL